MVKARKVKQKTTPNSRQTKTNIFLSFLYTPPIFLSLQRTKQKTWNKISRLRKIDAFFSLMQEKPCLKKIDQEKFILSIV